MRRFVFLASLLALLLGAFMHTVQVQASVGEVKVSIPVFPVTLDGVPIVQEHNKYPLITFKDITYFP